MSLDRDLDSLLGEAADAADGADRSRLELVAATHEELHPVEERVLQLTDDGQLKAARDALRDEYLPGAENVSDAIAAFLAAQEQDVAQGSQQVLDGTRQAAVVVLVVLGATASVLVYLLRVNHLQKLFARRRECEREAFATGQVRRSRIRNAFEMSLSGADSLTTFRTVLEQELKGWRSELLLADSSTAHLHRALGTHPGSEPACGVPTPTDCPRSVVATPSCSTRSMSTTRVLTCVVGTWMEERRSVCRSR